MVNSTDNSPQLLSVDVDLRKEDESTKTKHLFSTEIFERDELWNDFNIVQQVDANHSNKISSGVWKYFGKLHYDNRIVDEGYFYCISCYANRVTKKYQTNTSTGNLIKHMIRAHNITLEQPIYRIKRKSDSFTVIKEEYKGEPPSQNSNDRDEEGCFVVYDINEILIAEVHKRPQLYDSKLCHKNKHRIRLDLWNEVYETINHLIPLERLPKIWKNIRDRYQKVRRSCEKDEQKVPKYRYYDKLRFLDSIIDSSINKDQSMLIKIDERKNEDEIFDVLELDDMEDVEVANENIDCSEEEMVVRDTIFKCEILTNRRRNSTELNECNIDEISNYEYPDDSEVQDNQLFSVDNPSSDELSSKVKRTRQDVSSDYDAAVSVGTEKSSTLCEFDIFGNYVAAVMKNMRKNDARQLQMKIVQLINSYDEDESQ